MTLAMPSLDVPAIAELAAHHRWVCHRCKIPMQPDGSPASSTDPGTWASFVDCYGAVVRAKADGLGFVLGPPYVGIDLDGCVKNGRIRPDANLIVQRLASYTEISISGTGLHIIAKGMLPPGRRKKGWLEAYSESRYLTISGSVVGEFDTIESRPQLLQAFHRKYLGGEERAGSVSYESATWDGELPPTVLRAVEEIPSFRRQLEGTHAALRLPSESEVDWAIACNMAEAKFSPADIESALRWRRARLGKAKSESYFPRTVGAALARCREARP